MNNSTSTPSAAWPTIWPKGSFPAWPTVAVVAAAIVSAVIVFLVGAAWLRSTGAISPEMTSVPIVPAIVLQIVLEGAVAVILLVALPRLAKMSYAELGFAIPQAWQIGVALLGAIAMVIVADGGAQLVQTLTHQKHEQQVVELFKQILAQKSLTWFFAIFAIVIAPFMEETMFRIFVFNVGLRYGGFWIGAVISGLLFGLAHGDLMVLAPLGLGGMVLCAVYYRTRNVFCSMITHGCFNALTVFALIYAPQFAQ